MSARNERGPGTTSNETGETAIGADIAVTVPADVLAGLNPGFATAADGSWVAPAGWITELAATGNPFWHRMVIDSVTHDVLSHEYLGRFAPELLRKALEFRDGVCQTPGCLKPASECQIDHEEPWPEGKTTGSNLSPRCPRHHNAKGHRILTWKIKGRSLGPPRSRLEQHLGELTIEYAA